MSLSVTAPTDPLRHFTPRTETVSVAGETFVLEVLDDDEVLDAVGWEGARNPYFGQVWPAAAALADHLAKLGNLGGRTVLDLGCGPGLLGIVSGRLGAHVTFADVMPEALALAGRNAGANGVEAELVELDLRAPLAIGRFDLVLAADLLYEAWLPAALAAALRELLAPGGVALVADPMRGAADGFVELAAASGYEVGTIRRGPPVRIFQLG